MAAPSLPPPPQGRVGDRNAERAALEYALYSSILAILFTEPFIYNNLSNLRVPLKGFFLAWIKKCSFKIFLLK